MSKTIEQQYSVTDVAKLLGVSEETVWRLHKKWVESKGLEGIGPSYKLSHRITRFPASGVNGFLKRRETTMETAG